MEPNGPFRLAFSRPGLLTFKFDERLQTASTLPQRSAREDLAQSSGLLPKSPEQWIIRQSGQTLGQVRGESAEELAAQTLELAGRDWTELHVFERDRRLPGDRGFEPGPTELTKAIRNLIAPKLPNLRDAFAVNQISEPGSSVLDVILIEPDHWLVGSHVASEIHQTWPGGKFPFEVPDLMISRAYLKMAEGVAWSEFPIQAGDEIVEIGSSPGGASQRLLDLGLKVTGVDPAEMDSYLLESSRFDHWRNKSSAIKRKQYSKFKWLAADANVAPNYTLDAVEDIVNYPTSRFAGLLLTFKLTDYALGEKMDEYLARIRSWGFGTVKARQLASNRRECCVAALR